MKKFVAKLFQNNNKKSTLLLAITLLPSATVSIYSLLKPATKIQAQDKLVFQYSNDEIILASEKTFTSITPFTTTKVIKNTFNLVGHTLPLIPVRIINTLVSLLLLVTILHFNKNLFTQRNAPIPTQIDRINKKYGNRIIHISQKENIEEKSIITLTSFKSILKIADEKELPIFYHKVHHDGRAVYFIVDGDYLYTYETLKIDLVRSTKKVVGSVDLYAKD